MSPTTRLRHDLAALVARLETDPTGDPAADAVEFARIEKLAAAGRVLARRRITQAA